MIKALLIDDEISATELLKEQLNAYCPDVNVVATCNNSLDAAALINKHEPDIVFTDIEMPKLNGFELMQALPQINFQIIFVTAYNQFALKAFKYSALDYLLKPVEKDDLIRSINKFNLTHQKVEMRQLEFLKQFLSGNQSKSDRIGITVRDGVKFVDIKNIIRCQADDNYTRMFFQNTEPMLVTRTLGDFEEQLTEHGFFRISNSHLISLNFIERYSREDGGYVQMKDGETITVSKNKKDAFLKLVQKI